MRRQVVNALLLTIVVLGLAIWIDFFPGSFQQLTGRNVEPRLGLDLRGGSQIFLKPRDGTATNDELEVAAGVIERRVNGLGVSEAVVQTSDNSIIVELPGVTNAAEASASLQGAGNLEFIDPKGQYLPDGTEVCTTATPRYPPKQQSALGDTSVSAPGVEGDGGRPITPTNGLSATTSLSSTPTLSSTAAISATTPVTETEKECTAADQYTTLARGTDLDTGQVSLTTDQRGLPAVSFKFNGDSANQIATFTAQNVGSYMSIVLDNRVISSPVINGALPGEGIITMGQGQRAEQDAAAKDLLVKLKYGALPITLVEDSNRTVSATLGDDSVKASLIAGIVGLIIVALFMLLFYRLPGLLADIALLIYTAIAFALYNLIPVTLTLPGIAGFILSIGLAVDANVLIFARIKEELHRGRSLDRAVEDGFRHAWPSIRDSNAATLITCFILYFMGSSFGVSIIQGFALTLALGILVSLFTAITVTRLLLRLTIDFGMNHPRWFDVQHSAVELSANATEESA